MKRTLLLSVALMCCGAGLAQNGSGRLLAEMSKGDVTYTFKYDDHGRVSTVGCDYYEWLSTYDYSLISENIVTMKVESIDAFGKPVATLEEYTMKLGDNGLICRVDYTICNEVEGEAWSYDFTYNAYGNLIQIVADNGEEVYDFGYTDGNLTSLKATEDADEMFEATYSYTAAPNVGKLVFYDFYGQSFGTFDFAYLSGLMGTPSGNLLKQAVAKSGEEVIEGNYEWSLDEWGYPSEMTAEDYDSKIITTFNWNGTAGISNAAVDTDGTIKYYSTDGIELTSPQKGITIVRKPEGSTYKIVR